MGDTIIVGVDGSDTALRAATVAAKLAVEGGSALHVLTAFDDNYDEVVGIGSDQYRFSSYDAALGTARSVAEQVGAGVRDLTVGAREGEPHDALIASAKELGASLIVVGNRRMQGLGRVLGSVANSVAHHAPCDVYIVKTV